MSLRLVITFRFARGELVTVGSDPTIYRILQRRWTERDMLWPVQDYGLVPLAYVHGPMQWVSEADLARAPDSPE
jgi:hypothetical protein